VARNLDDPVHFFDRAFQGLGQGQQGNSGDKYLSNLACFDLILPGKSGNKVT
jgi:hypothetical protein